MRVRTNNEQLPGKVVLAVVATRPEVVKMDPVIRALKALAGIRTTVLAAAQHQLLLDQMIAGFALEVDHRIELMSDDQHPEELLARAVPELHDAIKAASPALVVGQGDTTTVLATALACHYLRIPFAHVEAGLRTGDMQQPYPEEMNRVLISRLTTLHFAPTQSAKTNLLNEGVPATAIFVTGNPVVDSLSNYNIDSLPDSDSSSRQVLVTMHRRENIGIQARKICAVLKAILAENKAVQITIPVHPNPGMRQIIELELGQTERISLVPPMPYISFIRAVQESSLVISDSGGIQEEACTIGTPVLLLRRLTERPEAIETGIVILADESPGKMVEQATRILRAGATRSRPKSNPFGDGFAGKRIAAIIHNWLTT